MFFLKKTFKTFSSLILSRDDIDVIVNTTGKTLKGWVCNNLHDGCKQLAITSNHR